MKTIDINSVRKSQTQTKFGGQERRNEDTKELAEKINEIVDWINQSELPQVNNKKDQSPNNIYEQDRNELLKDK